MLAQYEAFYRAVARAGADPRVARDLRRVEALLQPVATGRQLNVSVSRVVGGALAGEVPFGRVELRPEVVELTPKQAVIHDCQDTSKRGVKKNGRVEAHGMKQDSAQTSLVRGADGVWRVANTRYVEPPDRFC